MRLDKFLKVSRIFKRRTIAKEVSKNQRIKVNDRPAKPSTDVKEDDILKITYGNKELTVKIKEVTTHATKENSQNMYEIIEERKLN
ncbi:RNA-binding S4 domain-containing protein [Candidatus Izemoplasma sp. B36]|uniref:RNA-binding S4 domain-containing protein n=1 Tax=Candidatus Izemoplasma sp. B36 TaxID=3242468 RepID=UPI0035568EB1